MLFNETLDLFATHDFDTCMRHLIPFLPGIRNAPDSISNNPCLVPIIDRIFRGELDTKVPSQARDEQVGHVGVLEHLRERRGTQFPAIVERGIRIGVGVVTLVDYARECLVVEGFDKGSTAGGGDAVDGPHLLIMCPLLFGVTWRVYRYGGEFWLAMGFGKGDVFRWMPVLRGNLGDEGKCDEVVYGVNNRGCIRDRE